MTLRAFGVSQWYQWYTNIVRGFTNGTIGNTICTNGNANGTIGSPNGTIGTIGKPINGTIGKLMVPWATIGNIGKITNGTIGRTPNGSHCKKTDYPGAELPVRPSFPVDPELIRLICN